MTTPQIPPPEPRPGEPPSRKRPRRTCTTQERRILADTVADLASQMHWLQVGLIHHAATLEKLVTAIERLAPLK